MKALLFLFISFALSNCTSRDSLVAPPTLDSISVTVGGGFGSGRYKVGDTIFVWSNPPAINQVFDTWSGDANMLNDKNEWRAFFVASTANVSLMAKYKSFPAFTFIAEMINGSEVFYYVPTNYRGIIIPFHGKGGAAQSWVNKQEENSNFTRYAVANGYAVVITESVDRINRQWQISTNSVDVNNIDAILSHLANRGIISLSKPIYGVGMSQGGNFCSAISYQKNYKAASIYCIPGRDAVFTLSNVPTLWNMAQNDITEEPTRLVNAQTNFSVLRSRGVVASYAVNPPTPLYPERFTIISGIDVAGSTSIFRALQANGYINAKGYLTIDVHTNAIWRSVIPMAYQTSTYLNSIEDQLTVCYAQHNFYKDANYRTIAFFNQFP